MPTSSALKVVAGKVASGGGTGPLVEATSTTLGGILLTEAFAGTARRPTVPGLASRLQLSGGNPNGFFGADVPLGVLSDWTALTGVYANNEGKLWFRPASVAQTPTQGTTPTPSTDGESLSLAYNQFNAEYVKTDGRILTNGPSDYVDSRAVADFLTMAVLQRDQTQYDLVLNFANTKMKRTAQASLKNLYAKKYDNATSALTDTGVNSGDNVKILGALIRAWNLWARTSDRDLASAVATDIKNGLVLTDEGRAYLGADENQKLTGFGHHTFNSSTWFAVEIAAMRPVIFRMAKTFTGDVVFDNLVTGCYDIMNKAMNLWTLPPKFVAYDTASHGLSLVTNGSNGWNYTLPTNFDSETAIICTSLYADYKIYTEGKALSLLQGKLKTFFTNNGDAVKDDYSKDGAANSTTQNVRFLLSAYLTLTANDGANSTAAAIKANRLPTGMQTDSFGKYLSDTPTGVTERGSDRDRNARRYLQKAVVDNLYPDIILFGSNPNAGTTTGSTGSTGGGSTGGTTGGQTTTPPASTGTGIDIPTWYPNGVAPTGWSQSARMAVARARWDKFIAFCYKTTGMPSGMPSGAARIAVPDEVNDDPNKTVSEGQGYAMLAAVWIGNPKLPTGVYDSTAQDKFIALWKYTSFYLNQRGLMNWKIMPDGSIKGTGGATDGDEDIAMALMMAHRMWGSAGAYNWGDLATKMINAIRDYEFVPETGYASPNAMTNGDQWGFDNDTFFPDYFRPGWYREFYKHTGDERWLRIIKANYPLAVKLFYDGYTTGLNKDIKRGKLDNGGYNGPLFDYNNIRTSWSLMSDFLWNGDNADPLAKNQMTRMVTDLKARLAAGSNEFGQTGYTQGPQAVPAQPAVDWSYHLTGGNGKPYTNAGYVQAYGLPGLLSSTHSQWAADALTYLDQDTGQYYFSLGTAAVATMFFAGIAVPGSPASTGTSNTPNPPVVIPDTPSNTPTGTVSLSTDQTSRNTLWGYYAGLAAGTKKDRALWAAQKPRALWCGPDTGWDENATNMKGYIDECSAKGQTTIVVTYGIPGRDLGSYSGGGSANQTLYNNWIDKIVTAIGNRPVIMIYEPDSLPQADALPSDQLAARLATMKAAVAKLKQNCPNLYLYIDAGHSNWRSADYTADMLLKMGVEKANGFSLNVSNYRPDAELIAFGQNVAGKLNLPNARFVMDTGRNGNVSQLPGDYDNQALRRFGRIPQFGNTGVDRCDGWLWIKGQGESDAQREGWPQAGQFDALYLWNDSKADNDNGDGSTSAANARNSAGMLQRPPVPGVAQA